MTSLSFQVPFSNVASVFAPGAAASFSPAELTKCVRVYPHDNNSGGFFVALIRKTAFAAFEGPIGKALPVKGKQQPGETYSRISEKDWLSVKAMYGLAAVRYFY